MTIKEIEECIEKGSGSVKIEALSIDVIDAEIKSFRSEYGLNHEFKVSDAKVRMNHVDYEESSAESFTHGDKIEIEEIRLTKRKVMTLCKYY